MYKEKQKKVINKIKYDSGQDADKMAKSKLNRYDEYFANLQDVLCELHNYVEYLSGKDIICPCDFDILQDGYAKSIVIYFDKEAIEDDFSDTGKYFCISSVVLERYTASNDIVEEKYFGSEAKKFLTENVRCSFIKALIHLGHSYGIKSITASGYDTELKLGIKFEDINFHNYDFVITNPPFHGYKDFFDIILKESKERKDTDKPFDFLLLSSYRNRMSPCVGLPLMLKDCYLGFGRHLNLSFVTPNKHNNYETKEIGVDWITSFSKAQDIINEKNRYKKSQIDYSLYMDKYIEMPNITMRDGTHPIRIANKRVIPDNFFGWMWGSIGVLDDLPLDSYEWYITNAKKYFNTTKPESNPFKHRVTNEMVAWNVEKRYSVSNKKEKIKGTHGIVFRRRPVI